MQHELPARGDDMILLLWWIQKCCENASGLRYDETWHVPFFAASVIWVCNPERDSRLR